MALYCTCQVRIPCKLLGWFQNIYPDRNPCNQRHPQQSIHPDHTACNPHHPEPANTCLLHKVCNHKTPGPLIWSRHHRASNVHYPGLIFDRQGMMYTKSTKSIFRAIFCLLDIEYTNFLVQQSNKFPKGNLCTGMCKYH